jgi:hypothetical protein
MFRPTDLILVCVLPTPRDLEIARLLGWYRIPLRTAPKVVAVDYLAFYQPAAAYITSNTTPGSNSRDVRTMKSNSNGTSQITGPMFRSRRMK